MKKILAIILVLTMVMGLAVAASAAECPLVEGTGYKITANNANGALWLSNTVSSGRFDCTTVEADATVYYVEVVTGGYLLYFMDGETKTYIAIADKSTGGSYVTDAASATVLEWNADLNTLVVAEDSNNRAFGSGATSTYENFSSYDASQSGYNWGQFIAQGNGGNQGGNQGGNTGSQEPVTPPATNDSSIANGEYVIIAPAYNKALSSEKALNQDGSVGFYNAGADVTVSGSTVSGYGDTEKWIVTNNDDGSITISQNGKNLALADSYSSMNLGEVNDKWVLEDAGNGLYYVKNVVRGNYIEWYDSKNNWSSYNKINSGSEGLFALQFVALNVQEPSEPSTPSTPSEPNQPTGDLSVAGLVVAMMAATAGVVVLAKKKEF